MRVEEDHNNSKKLPEQANPIKKGSALLSYHQFLLNFVAMKNSCHKARWPITVISYSEIVEKINIKILCLSCYLWFNSHHFSAL